MNIHRFDSNDGLKTHMFFKGAERTKPIFIIYVVTNHGKQGKKMGWDIQIKKVDCIDYIFLGYAQRSVGNRLLVLKSVLSGTHVDIIMDSYVVISFIIYLPMKYMIALLQFFQGNS
jgi:hypothetical protein